jgi:hypothetical protein
VLGPITVAPGKNIDLGVIALEPSPVLHGRLLDPEGQPAEPGTRVFYSPRYREAEIGEGGLFELYTHGMPSPCWLGIKTREGGVQALRVELPAGDRPVELRMAPWRHVEIHVHGVPAKHRYCMMELYLHHESDPRNYWIYIKEIKIPSARDRIFWFKAGPGRYRVEAKGLHRFPDTVIEVNTAEPVQVADVDVLD